MASVGIDIIEINRLKIDNELNQRFLSPEESKELAKLTDPEKKRKFLASKWALKEAIFKALPQEHLVFSAINITKNQYKQPTVIIKDYQIALSLSHNQTSVIAIAVVF